jgi:6-phosphogluconolactonase
MIDPKPKTQNPTSIDVRIGESPPALAADAAELFMQRTQQAASGGKLFRVALSGGSTPRLLYGLLASDTFQGEIPWGNIQFFFGDERWVPHSHRDSNYKMARDELFKKITHGRAGIFPIPTEGLTPEAAAEQYEATLREEFGVEGDKIPAFDLIFLGMGDDGHTASLFPHTPALQEREKLVVPNYVEKLSAQRITLTAPVLQAANEVVFLVTGESKAPALQEVLEGKYNPEEYPAQLLRDAEGQVIWFVDRPAASQLKFKYREV